MSASGASRFRRGGKRLVSLVGATALAAAGIVGVGSLNARAATPTTLLDVPFRNASEADPGLKALDTACLTAASGAAPGGASDLAKCASSVNAPTVGQQPGYLQLTDARQGQRGGVVYDRPVPGNGGLRVTFDQFQYGGSGADGIAFFLVDGARNLTTTGGTGGSLGYAPINGRPGVEGGYLGLGLDAFGNYARDAEGRGQGCATKSPHGGYQKNSVTLRGPGDGLNGYCWMATAPVPGGLHADTLEASKRKVEIVVSAETRPLVTVTINGVQVLSQRMTQDAPATWKLGFAASTGGYTDTHLIRDLKVETLKPLDQLNLVKQVAGGGPATYGIGDKVNYQFLITNTGPVPLSAVSVADPRIQNVSCPRNSLDAAGSPNASMLCTGTYTVTKADVRAGDLTNTAQASATSAGQRISSNESSATVKTRAVPGLALTKTAALDAAQAPTADAGETIRYSFAVTNIGDTPINQLKINDPRLTNITCDATTLALDQKTTCRGTYKVTQADVDAGGSIKNTARAVGQSPAGQSVQSPESRAEIPVTPAAPGISLVKTAQVTTGGDALADAGETVRYTLTATNTGNQTLTGVQVTDPKLPGLSCTVATLAPKATKTCTADYTVTQADVDAGTLTNTASVRGTSPSGTQVTDKSSATTPVAAPSPKVALVKSAKLNDGNGNNVADAGEKVTYSFQVTNAGNLTLTNPKVNDPRVTSVSCPTGALQPGASVTCTATYTVTQADVDAGSLVNTATATAQPPSGGPVTSDKSTAEVPVATPAPQVELTKTPKLDDANGNRSADAGETISYSFTVKNLGNVTLSSLKVADPRLAGVTCAATTLAPGASTTCRGTAPLTVTQADVDAGAVLNEATVTGNSPSGAKVTDNATASVPTVPADPTIALEKTATLPDGATQARVGQTVSYQLKVTNTGNVTLRGVKVTDPRVSDLRCPATEVAPGASITCTASHVVTQDDVDAGLVYNEASVQGTPPTGDPVKDSSEVRVPTVPGQPGLALTKTAQLDDANGNGAADAGEQIAYSFTATNNGNVTLTRLVIRDDKLAGVTCEATRLAPGVSTTCRGTAPYTVTQADVDAGEVINTASASAVDPKGTPTQADASARVETTAPAPAIGLTKTAQLDDADGNGAADAGEQISYTFTVTNNGNVTLSQVALTDTKLEGVACDTQTLAPGGSTTCRGTAPYVVTQADVDAGEVVNHATVSAVDPKGTAVNGEAEVTVQTTAAKPTLELVKTAQAEPGVKVGQTITYSFQVTNTGNVTLTDVTVTDPLVTDLSCPGTELAPGGSFTCSATHVVTQDEVDAGKVHNEASATGTHARTGEKAQDSDTEDVPTDPAKPLVSLVKTADLDDANGNGSADAGERIAYSFTVTNTGNVTLSQVSVNDDRLEGVTCEADRLAPGATTTCKGTAPYTVTQADVDAGSVVNQATVTAKDPSGTDVNGDASTVTPTVPSEPQLELTKRSELADANGNGAADAGEQISYSFTVTNTGNVTLSQVAVSDDRLEGVTCEADRLAPGAATTCSGTAPYTVTQADVDAGFVVNQATATAVDPREQPVTGEDTNRVDATEAAPAVTLVKTAVLADANGNTTADAGEQISYSFTVTNNGNVTLSQVAVQDAKLAGVTCEATPLAPGASTTCQGTAPYTVTQADVDAGEVVNTATVTAVDPRGTTVNSTDDARVEATEASPALQLEKTAGSQDEVKVGDTVTYTFKVTNTGNVTLTGVSVTDPMVSDLSCPESVLAPGASVTCTASHQVTQDQVDAGKVHNEATATGTHERTGKTAQDTDTEDVPTVKAAPALTVEKKAELNDADGNGSADAGEQISYSFTVTNTGNVTLSALTIRDDKLAGVTCQTEQLAPGASTTCQGTAPYTVTQADVDAGEVVNQATAQATDPSGTPVSDDDTARVETTKAAPALTVDKSAQLAEGQAEVKVGETVAYSFTVTNTGNVTLSDVTVTDPRVTDLTCPATTLAPGASMTCAASLVVTQDDVDAGQVRNQAIATGTHARTGEKAEDSDTEDVPTDPAKPVITLVKTADLDDANDNGSADAGERISYSFTVTNTGNVTLSQVVVSDDRLEGVTCEAASLAPGASTTCQGTAPYTVTQADVDGGSVVNHAAVSAKDPSGKDVAGQATTVTPTVPADPAVTVAKHSTLDDANGNGTADVGEQISYSFTVTNTGNVTVSKVALRDDKLEGVTCESEALAPGSSTTCRGTAAYTVTQADVDAGVVLNHASVSADDPSGRTVTNEDEDRVTTVEAEPEVELVKTAEVADDHKAKVGETITYSFKVTNTGNVTLTDVTVTDPLVGDLACPATTLAPGASMTCTASHQVTQDEVDAGKVHNEATAIGTHQRTGEKATSSDTEDVATDPAAPVVVLEKKATLDDANDNGSADAGEKISYSFTVTNNGNVTLTEVSVSDDKLEGVSCEATRLAPGASTTCQGTAPYTVTQADVDAGSVVNHASVTAKDPAGQEVGGKASAVTSTSPATPEVELVKRGSLNDANGNGSGDAGETITFSFTITNTGNVTLTGVSVNDAMVRDISCPDGGLAPGQSVECTAAPYTITAADATNGVVRNVATATGKSPGGEVSKTPPSTVEVKVNKPVDPRPGPTPGTKPDPKVPETGR